MSRGVHDVDPMGKEWAVAFPVALSQLLRGRDSCVTPFANSDSGARQKVCCSRPCSSGMQRECSLWSTSSLGSGWNEQILVF